MHYIRFLKPAQISTEKGGRVTVSTLISVTTDLGDSFFAEDLTLYASILSNEKIIIEKSFLWTETSRSLSISLPLDRPRTVTLRIGGTTGNRPDELRSKALSAWSAPFGGAQGNNKAARLVQRRLRLGGEQTLQIWEETGESIACHIWDAALACLLAFREAIHISSPSSREGRPLLRDIITRTTPDSRSSPTPFRAIELGAGCGIVGIGLASMMPACEVVLTDLAAAQDILERNTSAATLNRGSSTTLQILDWEQPLPETICQNQYDAILVSDCTYNPDSLPGLIQILGLLNQQSPAAAVVVALKRRHESEAVFFELMQSVGFRICDQSKLSLSTPAAGIDTEDDDEDETRPVEIYIFRK